MISIEEKSRCSGCHACSNACPQKCIQMLSDEEGFWYPQVDKEKCIDCGLCDNICPIIHKWEPSENRKTTAMAAINLNEEIRLKSSSGGIFTLIAEKIIKQGGVVFGAAFSDDFRTVHHICVDNIDDLKKLRGSKYVQSKIGDSYKLAKDFLDSGRKVLFTGTPCQIGGLYSYLRKPYDNLFTQDIICHGVPSPLIWKKYLDEREKKAAAKVIDVCFRYKVYGWQTYSIAITFSNNSKYIKLRYDDPYINAFASNCCLRPSCYNCSFKGITRQSDLTLADLWGCQSYAPEMFDDRGVSLLLLHSNKGQELVRLIRDCISMKNVDENIVKSYNTSAVASAIENKNRSLFFQQIRHESLDRLSKTMFRRSLKKKLKSLLIRTGIVKLLKRCK